MSGQSEKKEWSKELYERLSRLSGKGLLEFWMKVNKKDPFESWESFKELLYDMGDRWSDDLSSKVLSKLREIVIDLIDTDASVKKELVGVLSYHVEDDKNSSGLEDIERREGIHEGTVSELLVSLRKMIGEQAGTAPMTVSGVVVDKTLAKAPEQNYAYQWKKWEPAGVPKGAKTVYGPGLYEERTDVMKALSALANELAKKFPMRKPGEPEPPERLEYALKRVKEEVEKLKLPEQDKRGIMHQLMKHDYVRGWDVYSDRKGLMWHLNDMGMKYGGHGVIEEIQRMVERLKAMVLESL